MKFNIVFLACCIVAMSLIGVKLYNIGKAQAIVNRCFVIPSEVVIFQVTGYEQKALELRGRYFTEGLFFIIPFVDQVPQRNLELGIEKGFVEEFPCKEFESDD